MYVIMVIGGAQQGKTPFIKDYCKDSNLLINDVQDEYGNRTKYPGQIPYGLTENNLQPRSRYIKGDLEEFMKICANKRNTVCVFEEATLFFQGMTGKEMRKLIFGKAHTKNVYVLVFHSINSVPPRLMEGTNFVVLFKTNDETDTVEGKYKRLLPYFNKLQSMKDGTHVKIKMI